MRKNTLLTLAFILVSINLFAQKQVTLNITHKLGNSPFAFNQASKNNLNQDFKIDRIDYYLSGFTIIHDGGLVTKVPDSTYILAKGSSNVSANLGTFNVTNIEGIKFHVGIDTPVNLSDPALYVSPHPLAPQSPSMHWGWLSGFRYVALEGTSGPTFNLPYEIHSLYVENYFEQVVMANGVANGNTININLRADLNEALRGININVGPIDHGNNATDLTVLKNFRDYVFAPIDEPASIAELNMNLEISVFPNPSSGQFQIDLRDNPASISTIQVCDISGRLIKELNVPVQKMVDVSLSSAGLYFLKFYGQSELMAIRKIIVE